jgi:hypothetical protein
MGSVTGHLDVDVSDEDIDERDGTKFVRRRLTKVFYGGFEGTSTGEFLLALGSADAAAYVGLDHVNGTLGGRSGAFVLVHSATRSRDGESASITVLGGSATDELTGLGGDLTIAVSAGGAHSYTFDYRLP